MLEQSWEQLFRLSAIAGSKVWPISYGLCRVQEVFSSDPLIPPQPVAHKC